MLKKDKRREIKRLFFDIETSPNVVYSWNIGYDIKLEHSNIVKERAVICICYKWEGSNNVYHLTWNRGDDKEMILKFADIIKLADEVVGHNGDNFDIKWFRTRCLYHGVQGMPEIKSIDTLKIAKSTFRFNSNRLDYIAQFLGLEGKIKTDFELWKRVIGGEQKALREMVEYCKWDVELLEKVYNKMSKYTKPKTNVAILKGGNKCNCPSCGSKNTYSNGNAISSVGTVKKKMHCQDCGSYFQVPFTIYKKHRLD
jgi:DNA polymerase elongation subunit (family B)